MNEPEAANLSSHETEPNLRHIHIETGKDIRLGDAKATGLLAANFWMMKAWLDGAIIHYDSTSIFVVFALFLVSIFFIGGVLFPVGEFIGLKKSPESLVLTASIGRSFKESKGGIEGDRYLQLFEQSDVKDHLAKAIVIGSTISNRKYLWLTVGFLTTLCWTGFAGITFLIKQ